MNNTMIESRLERINRLLEEKGLAVFTANKFHNNHEKSGIAIHSIHEREYSAAPVFYYDKDFWEKPDEEIVNFLIDFYEEKAVALSDITFDYISPEYILEHVLPTVCSGDNIPNMQKMNIIYTQMLDIAVSFYVTLSEEIRTDEQGVAMFRLTEMVLQHYKLTKEEVLQAAFSNLEKDVRLSSIEEVLAELIGLPEGVVPNTEIPILWVLTNSNDFHGAAVIASRKILTEIEKTLGSEYIILPSSIHEVLCMPYQPDMDMTELVEIVRGINANHVPPEDRLTDNVYIWKKGKLSAMVENLL